MRETSSAACLLACTVFLVITQVLKADDIYADQRVHPILVLTGTAKRPTMTVRLSDGAEIRHAHVGSVMRCSCEAELGSQSWMTISLVKPRKRGYWTVAIHQFGGSVSRSIPALKGPTAKNVETISFNKSFGIGVVIASVDLLLKPEVNGIVCACHSYDASQSVKEGTVNTLNDPLAVWSKPLNMEVDAWRPAMTVYYHKPPATIFGNRRLSATCKADIQVRGGRMAWILVASGKSSRWESSAGRQPPGLPEQVTITIFPYRRSKHSLISNFSILVNSSLTDATLQCESIDISLKGVQRSKASRPFVVYYKAQKPILTIRYEDSKSFVYGGARVEASCTAHVGTGGYLEWDWTINGAKDALNERGLPLLGHEGDHYPSPTQDSLGDPLDPVKTLRWSLWATAKMEGAAIECTASGGVAGEEYSLSSTSRKFHVRFLTGLPELEVYYHNPPSVIYGNSLLEAKCQTHPGTGGYQVWVLNTTTQMYSWEQQEGDVPSGSPPRVNITQLPVPLDYQAEYFGPRIVSNISIVVDASLQDATLQCRTYSRALQRGEVADFTEKSLPLNVQYRPVRPTLEVQTDWTAAGERVIRALCSADVGSETEGIMTWTVHVANTTPATVHIDLLQRITQQGESSLIHIRDIAVSNDSRTGPRISSRISVPLTDNMLGATVACCSCNTSASPDDPGGYDNPLIASSKPITESVKQAGESIIVRVVLLALCLAVILVGVCVALPFRPVQRQPQQRSDAASITTELMKSYVMGEEKLFNSPSNNPSALTGGALTSISGGEGPSRALRFSKDCRDRGSRRSSAGTTRRASSPRDQFPSRLSAGPSGRSGDPYAPRGDLTLSPQEAGIRVSWVERRTMVVSPSMLFLFDSGSSNLNKSDVRLEKETEL